MARTRRAKSAARSSSGDRQRKSSRAASSRSSPPVSPPSQPTSSGPVSSVNPSPSRSSNPPSIGNYLAGDEVYQSTIRSGERTLQDFLSQVNRREEEAETSYAQTQEAMEEDRERQLEALKNEFASRGLIHSGIYGKEQGEFQEDFARQREQLDQQQTSLLNDLISQRVNARREQELALESARQEALARRASRYNIT